MIVRLYSYSNAHEHYCNALTRTHVDGHKLYHPIVCCNFIKYCEDIDCLIEHTDGREDENDVCVACLSKADEDGLRFREKK
jgi:hypothetical protein